MPPVVLVVDDEEPVRTLLRRYLELEGYEVEVAADAAGARDAVERRRPDLVLLDVMLPGQNGLDLLADLRAQSEIPVILLTGRDEESDRVVGLRLGADDYVVKPFSSPELAARIATVLRRFQAAAAAATAHDDRHLRFDGLELDLSSREVFLGGEVVEMPPREFDLLAFLARSPREVFSRDQLLAEVWGSSSDWQDPGTVTEHVRRIRRRIEPDPDQPRWLRTVRGSGYRFEPAAISKL